MRRVPGRWWGLAALGPPATIVSKLLPSAPRRRISVSSSRPKLLGPGHVVGLEAEPGQPGRGLHDHVLLALVADLDVDVDAGGAQLLGRLLLVAAVAHEQGALGADQQQGGRAREAGQVADVDQPGDQQGITPRPVQLAPEALQPRREVHRGKVGEGHVSSNRSATVAIAFG
jgi:hypothetical protein